MLVNLTYLVVTILACARLAPTKTQVTNGVGWTRRGGEDWNVGSLPGAYAGK